MGLSSRVAKETCNGAKIKSKVTASLYWLFHSISYADRAQTSESLIYSYPGSEELATNIQRNQNCRWDLMRKSFLTL